MASNEKRKFIDHIERAQTQFMEVVHPKLKISLPSVSCFPFYRVNYYSLTLISGGTDRFALPWAFCKVWD